MPGNMDPIGQVAQLLGVVRTQGSRTVAAHGGGDSRAKESGKSSGNLVNVSHSGAALADMASRLREVGFVHDPQGGDQDDQLAYKMAESKDGARLKEFRETDEHKQRRVETKKKLTREEQDKIRDMKDTDAKVRAHEMAHKSAAGSLASGGPYYEMEAGPDGVNYAVAGHVAIHVPETTDAEQALRDSEQAKRAALAPADPSPADRAAAAQFGARANQARQQIAAERQEAAQADKPGANKPGANKPGANKPGASKPEAALEPPSHPEQGPTKKAPKQPVAAHQHPEFLLGPASETLK